MSLVWFCPQAKGVNTSTTFVPAAGQLGDPLWSQIMGRRSWFSPTPENMCHGVAAWKALDHYMTHDLHGVYSIKHAELSCLIVPHEVMFHEVFLLQAGMADSFPIHLR